MISEATVLSRQLDTSVVGQLWGWPRLPRGNLQPLFIHTSDRGLTGNGTRIVTAPNEDILRLGQLLEETCQQLETFMFGESASQPPDVFDLRPISIHRITVKVVQVGPARFHFVAGEDDFLDDATN